MPHRPNSFTLIELLIVIGVVAILSVAVVMALNPTQLMAQGRDATRLNDLDTLNHALVLYGAERSAFGSPNTIYVSVPDPTIATTNGTSTCTGLGLSTANLPSGWTYQCASTSSVQDVDGTGWLPVNFTQITSKPLSQLPLDPVNTTSSGNYYTYVTNGSQWELTSIAESQKYKSQTNSKTPFQPGLLAQGSSLALSPLFSSSGLIGYWNFDEGSGTIAKDSSGNGNDSTWNGTPGGTSGTFYVSGKAGYAGYFNGSNNFMSASGPNLVGLNALTLSAWVKPNSLTGAQNLFEENGPVQFFLSTNKLEGDVYTGANGWKYFSGSSSLLAGQWNLVSMVYNGQNISLYVNGSFDSSTTQSGITAAGPGCIEIGRWNNGACGGGAASYLNGLLDDLRIYNRALSASEVQALYNATK